MQKTIIALAIAGYCQMVGAQYRRSHRHAGKMYEHALRYGETKYAQAHLNGQFWPVTSSDLTGY